MASTQSGKPAPNFGRRIKWLGIAAALVAVLYSGGWFWLAREGERRLDIVIAETANSGRTAECVNRQIKGYPFRLGLFCDKTAFADDERGIVFNAGALRSAAQVYNPKHAIVELDGPAFVETQDIPPVELNWSLLNASVRASLPVPQEVRIIGKDIVAMLQYRPAFKALQGGFFMRREEADISFAGEWSGVEIDPAVTPGRTIPPYSVTYDIVVKDGVHLVEDKVRSARNQSADIRTFMLEFASGGKISASGPVSANGDGLISGDLRLTFTDAAILGTALASAVPEAASAIGPALTAAGMASGKDKQTSLTLTIRDGKVSAGIFPLGFIPPVK